MIKLNKNKAELTVPANIYRELSLTYNTYINIQTLNDYDSGGIFLIKMKNTEFKFMGTC